MILSKEKILSRLKQLENQGEISIVNNNEKFIDIKDYIEERVERFRFVETITNQDTKDLFDFGSCILNKKLFFDLVEKYVDIDTLINVSKIYFFHNHLDYFKAREKYQDLTYDFFQYLGWREACEKGTIIIVNLETIRKNVDNFSHLQKFNQNQKVNLLTFEVLLHELRHALTNNILLSEDELSIEEDNEEKIISYSREIVLNNLINEYFLFLQT